MKGLLGN